MIPYDLSKCFRFGIVATRFPSRVLSGKESADNGLALSSVDILAVLCVFTSPLVRGDFSISASGSLETEAVFFCELVPMFPELIDLFSCLVDSEADLATVSCLSIFSDDTESEFPLSLLYVRNF